MGKKVEELKNLISTFGGSCDPTDDTVGDLICKLVKVACKSYEVKAKCINGVWSVETPYAEIQTAVENGESLYLKAEVGENTYEVFNWVSYVDHNNLHCVVFARTECYESEMWCRTLYINSDNTTEFYETYFYSE